MTNTINPYLPSFINQFFSMVGAETLNGTGDNDEFIITPDEDVWDFV